MPQGLKHACVQAKKNQDKEEKKYEARIRRMIKGGKKKSTQVPELMHKLWAKGSKARREMAKILLECGGDKDLNACMLHACIACADGIIL